ncbi:MAG: DUF2125 domain-containing protein [Paracoccaceae bacterium]
MRKLITAILVVAGLWGGYWFVGSYAVERSLTAWLTDRQNEGWIAEYSSLETHGFPNRFDTTISDIGLADTRSGIAWQAPFFQVFALSYKPNHIIAIWPDTQTLSTPYQNINITNDRMRASVIFEAGTAFTLSRSDFELENFSLRSNLGWSASVGKGQFSTRQVETDPDSHKIWFEASDVYPSAALLSRLNPTHVLPDMFETLTVDTTLTFDAPWDRFAVEQQRPQITKIDLTEMRASWGDIDIRAAGELQVDAQGMPTGEITVKAKNWRDILNIAIETGAIPASMTMIVTRALQVMAEMAGDPKTLDATLTFRNGQISLGVIPLGPAPRLTIR